MKRYVLLAVIGLGLIAGPALADAFADAQAGQNAQVAGDNERAVFLLTQALDAKTLSRDNTELAHVVRARAYVALQKLDFALADVDLARAILPNDRDALNMLSQIPPTAGLDAGAAFQRGGVLEVLGDLEGAFAAYGRCIDANPNADVAYFRRGNIWLRKNELERAIVDFNRSVQLQPNLPGAYEFRGFAFAMQGHRIEADADFLRSGALAVAGTPGANQRCWYAALANAGLDQALSDCDAAVASAPRQYAFLDSRALARLRRGELDQALADYDAAIDLFAKDPWTLYCRGVTRIRKGMTAKGRADIAAAVAIDASVPARARAIGITP